MRLNVGATSHDTGLCPSQLKRRSFKARSTNAVTDIKTAGCDLCETDAVQITDDFLSPNGIHNALQRLNRRNVQRVSNCLRHENVTTIDIIKVLNDDIRSNILNRLIFQHVLSRPTKMFKGEGICEECFNGRTRLTAHVDGTIQQAFTIIETTTADTNDFTRFIVHGHNCGLDNLIWPFDILIFAILNGFNRFLKVTIHCCINTHRNIDRI